MNPTLDTNKLLADSTKVAQNAAKTIGANFVQGVGVVPNVITPSSLTSTNPIQLPQTNGSTSSIAGAAVQGATEGLNTGIQSMISAEDKKIADARTAFDSSMTQRQSFIDKLMGKGAAQVQAETTAGIPEKTQALTDITNEYNTKALEYRRMEEAVQKEAMLTDAQKSARLREISRVKNTELADIGIKQAVAQNNLSAAQSLVDRKIDLEYGDLKDLIGYQTDVLNMNKADLTKAEQNQLNLMITDNTRKYEEGKKIGEFAKTVAANGAPAEVISRVSSAKTMADAAQAAGQYAGDVLDRQIKQAQLDKLNQEIISAGIGTKITNSQAGQYSSALNVILGSGKFTKDQKADVIRAVNNGEDPFAVVKNQAKNIMGQTLATSLDKSETAKAQIESIGVLLSQYYANGGKTNIFSGNFEKTINKLGEVNDSKLVEIATSISSALQIYRNAVSGTAYSVQEGKEISSIFPGINKSEGLNTALIKGRVKAFEDTIDATYRNTLGSTYDSLKKLQTGQSAFDPLKLNSQSIEGIDPKNDPLKLSL